MFGSLQMTLDEIKVLYADAMLELHAWKKEAARLGKVNQEQAKTIKLLSEQLPSESAPSESANHDHAQAP